MFSGVAGISADELLAEAVGAVEAAAFHYEERRSRTEWGASGPEIQEIIINFASDVGAGVTIAVLLDRLTTIVIAARGMAGRRVVRRSSACG